MKTLIGITPSKLIKLLYENKFRIGIKHLPKLLPLIFLSVRNSIYAVKEKKKYGSVLNNISIDKPPIFILGHWRSGTSYFKRLLSLDKQFAYPTVFQIYNPSTFLYTEPVLRARLEKIPKKKRPMDNMEVGFDDPGEEEFAVSVLSLRSQLLGWVFPANGTYYDRYLTFKDVTQKEIDEWKKATIYFLKKVLFINGKRQLLLKSPQNTGKIKVLLELFPDAKFIHIHRHPFDIFRSTYKLHKETVANFYLQSANNLDLTQSILNRYKIMYDAFFEDRKLLSEKQYIDIGFGQLQKNPVQTIANIYEQLELNGFDAYKPHLSAYLQGIKNYKKNTYQELDKNLQNRIYEAWQQSFAEWNYEV